MKKMLISMVMGAAACAVLPSVAFAAGVSASLCPQETNDPGPGIVGKLYPQEENDPGPAVVGNYPQEGNDAGPGIVGKLCPQEANEPPYG